MKPEELGYIESHYEDGTVQTRAATDEDRAEMDRWSRGTKKLESKLDKLMSGTHKFKRRVDGSIKRFVCDCRQEFCEIKTVRDEVTITLWVHCAPIDWVTNIFDADNSTIKAKRLFVRCLNCSTSHAFEIVKFDRICFRDHHGDEIEPPWGFEKK